MTTQRCAVCGCEDRWDAATQVDHVCVACGRSWDQDANACRNMLAARERGDGKEISESKTLAKWAKRGRHNGAARKDTANAAQEQRN
jgi:transposase